MTVCTRIRLLTANFRITPVPEDTATGHDWTAVRKKLTVDLLKYLNPNVIAGQECATLIRTDLQAALGASWKFVRSGNVIVWYNTNSHSLVDSVIFNLPSPAAADGTIDPRRLVLVKLKMKATGDEWWAASTHFTAGQPDWQEKQMEAAVAFIASKGITRNLIFGGDFNAGGTTADTPRAAARAGGLFPLRDKLAAPRIGNVTSNSFNNFQLPLRDGFWIDDILTGDQWQPYWGRVVDTNGASDHQWIIASSIQIG